MKLARTHAGLWLWSVYLPDDRYTPINGESFPFELIPKILLEIYDAFSEHYPERGRALCRTLASCRLVCYRWSRIVKSTRNQFIIQANSQEWPAPSFSYYLLRCTSLPLQDGSEMNQENDLGWFSESYAVTVLSLRPKFPPELILHMIPWLSMDGICIGNTE